MLKEIYGINFEKIIRKLGSCKQLFANLSLYCCTLNIKRLLKLSNLPETLEPLQNV